jgi:hypothetical protein
VSRAQSAANAPTPAQLREHLSDSWASAFRVIDDLRVRAPEAHGRCKLAIRMLTDALLVLDREVAALE